MIDTTQLKAIDIKEVWQALGYEPPAGQKNVRCFGPAHKNGDRNPSLSFDSKSNRFKCFACDLQGDTIELVQQAQGLDFKQATEWLSDAFGVHIRREKAENEYKYISRPNKPIKAPTHATPEPIRNQDFIYQAPEHIEIYRAFYKYCTEPSLPLKAWWKGRGLSTDLLQQAGWRSITKDTWLKLAKSYTSQQLLEAGLLTARDGQLTPLFYKHTVAVPFFDADDLIYLRARTLDPSVKAKYLAPRYTSPPIYNYQAIARFDGQRPLFITESETDALALSEIGEASIALVGGQKHPESLVVREACHFILKGLSPKIKVYIVADKDPTGEQFFTNIAQALYLAGVPSGNLYKYQCEHDNHKDIAECLQNRTLTPAELPNGLTDNNLMNIEA